MHLDLCRTGALSLVLLVGCSAPTVRDVHILEPERAAWSSIGRSHDDRELAVRTFGHGPLRVYWIGGIHGDEPEGGRELDGLIALLEEPRIRAGATVRVLRDANPDGTAAGTRGNARGVDLNRNLPATSFQPGRRRGAAPLSEPESAALWADLRRFEPDLVVVLHSATAGPFVNFDGPAEPWARRFLEGALGLDPRWRLVADMGYPTPGSLGTAVGVEGGVPILTLELRRGADRGEVRPSLLAGAAALLQAPAPATP